MAKKELWEKSQNKRRGAIKIQATNKLCKISARAGNALKLVKILYEGIS